MANALAPQLKRLKVLLIEDNPRDVRLIQDLLTEVRNSPFELEWVDRLSLGLERLTDGNVDVVLLDLSLPDSSYSGTFERVRASFPDVPIVVLTGLNDKSFSFETVRHGAQDYLVKGEFDGSLFVRSILFAIERHKMQAELDRLHKRVEEMALRDPLTQVYNRHFMHEALRREMERFKRYRHPFSLLMLDLDRFKEINDSFGHLAGDAMLKKIAQDLQAHLRPSDLICRYGGDEFIAVLPETPGEEAHAMAERLRARLAEETTVVEEGGLRIKATISLGIVEYKEGQTQDELIRRVDKALYAAKQKGRNAAVLE